MTYRESDDKGFAILYVSEKVAVFRAGNQHSIVIAHWVNKPTLVMSTGDQVDKYLVTNLRKICYSKENQIILGYGSNPDRSGVSEEGTAKFDDKYFVLGHDKNVQFFSTEVEMKNYAEGKYNFKDGSLMSVSEFLKMFSAK